MMRRAFVPRENLDKHQKPKIFGEPFQPEDSLTKLLDGWCLRGYIDKNQIEHIRMYAAAVDAESSQLWEILSYDQDEAPLELLMLRDNI